MNKPKTLQVNNLKIVPFLKGDVIEWNYKVIAPDGRVLEEFASQGDALSFASQTKDFLRPRVERDIPGIYGPGNYTMKGVGGWQGQLSKVVTLNGWRLRYSSRAFAYVAKNIKTGEIFKAKTDKEVIEFARNQKKVGA